MFRFTIREFVLLTLVAAMGVGWWLEREQLKAQLLLERNAAVAAAKESESKARLARVQIDYLKQFAPKRRGFFPEG